MEDIEIFRWIQWTRIEWNEIKNTRECGKILFRVKSIIQNNTIEWEYRNNHHNWKIILRNSFCIVPFRLLINIDTKTTFIKNISLYIQLFSFERNSLYNSSFRSSETISNSHLGGIITLTTVNFIRSTFKTNCFFPKIPVSSSLSIHLLPIHVSRKYEESLSLSLFLSSSAPPLLFTIECVCHHRGARLLPTDRCLRVFIYFMDDVGWRHLATVKCFS